MGISDGDLRLQKEYSAPFFGGEEKTDGEYASEAQPLGDIVSENIEGIE